MSPKEAKLKDNLASGILSAQVSDNSKKTQNVVSFIQDFSLRIYFIYYYFPMNVEIKQNHTVVELQAEQAYRVQRPIEKISLTLLEGTAEIFGKELMHVGKEGEVCLNQKYEYIFDDLHPFSIFTWTYAKIKIGYLISN